MIRFLLKKKLIIALILISIVSIGFATSYGQQKYVIPNWIKGVAGFWAEDKISDSDFGEAITFLITNDIIRVPLIEELENKNAQLKKENVELKTQLMELNQHQQDAQSQSYSPKTTEQKSSLSFPKITKRYDGKAAGDKLMELVDFHVSLTDKQRLELASRSVNESEFVIGVVFAGEWSLAYTQGNFDIKETTGSGVATIPYDCSHNFDYIYSIVGVKIDELGKISVYLFKNGVMIDKENSEKPYGTAIVGGICDEPRIVDLTT